MKNKTTPTSLAIFALMISMSLLSACGKNQVTTANSSNANSSANSNSVTKSENSNSAPVSDKPPITIDVGNITESEFFEFQDQAGRILTATGYLVNVSDDEKKLTLSYGKVVYGNTFICKGDFAKYTGMKAKIADSVKNSNPPKATIKGVIAKEQTGTELVLETCVLSDLKANP